MIYGAVGTRCRCLSVLGDAARAGAAQPVALCGVGPRAAQKDPVEPALIRAGFWLCLGRKQLYFRVFSSQDPSSQLLQQAVVRRSVVFSITPRQGSTETGLITGRGIRPLCKGQGFADSRGMLKAAPGSLWLQLPAVLQYVLCCGHPKSAMRSSGDGTSGCLCFPSSAATQPHVAAMCPFCLSSPF